MDFFQLGKTGTFIKAKWCTVSSGKSGGTCICFHSCSVPQSQGTQMDLMGMSVGGANPQGARAVRVSGAE